MINLGLKSTHCQPLGKGTTTLSIMTFSITTLSIMTFSITSVSIMALFATLSISDTRHNDAQHNDT